MLPIRTMTPVHTGFGRRTTGRESFESLAESAPGAAVPAAERGAAQQPSPAGGPRNGGGVVAGRGGGGEGRGLKERVVWTLA